MFELWQKIEGGAVVIPIRPEALSRLERTEVSELYPELVPDKCRISAGFLTCSCGISGCDGKDSQTVHMSERMVRWDVFRYRQRYEFFFEREAYDVGIVRMLHDLCRKESGTDYNVGGGYETRDLLIDGVVGMLSRHPHYSDIWMEYGFEPL